MTLTLGLTMLVSAAIGNTALASTTPVPIAAPYIPQSQTVREYVSDYFADIPVMIDIAGCESKFRQYDKKGNVLRGIVYKDMGVMQVNEYYHQKEIDALGIDISTIEGNVEFARYLYEKEGTTPWASSAKCWQNGDQNAAGKNLAVNK